MRADPWRLRSLAYDFCEGPDRRRGDAKARLFGHARGRTLLVAAGTGLDFKHLPRTRVVAIDFCNDMLTRARRRLGTADAHITLARADAMSLPFRNAAFDSAITSCSLCSITRPHEALNEIRRVLKPDGTLALFEHVRSRQPLLAWTLDLMTLWTRRSGTDMNRRTLEAVEDAGFQIVAVESVFVDIVLAVRAIRPEVPPASHRESVRDRPRQSHAPMAVLTKDPAMTNRQGASADLMAATIAVPALTGPPPAHVPSGKKAGGGEVTRASPETTTNVGSVESGRSELWQRFEQLALNLWWTWQPDVIELFRAVDADAWREANHNPIALLQRYRGEEFDRHLDALGLTSRVTFWYHRLQEYLTRDDTWCNARGGSLSAATIAYFSPEFGLHESLPLYSGGLGVLAGDYLKSASEPGLPVVGVGLFYANGYFRQRVDASGWQHEEYGTTDLNLLPLVRAAAADGSALTVAVQAGPDTLRAGVWLAHIGRTRLVLLDSDLPVNPPPLRELTARLYGGDERTRIRQEILLGIGGVRAVRALDIRPSILHLNEGHSAFAILERVRERIEEDGLGFDDAWRATTIQTVFTTHTPVEAGHDRFSPELVDEQLGWVRQPLGIDLARLMAIGRVDPGNAREALTMTVIGLKGARHKNGVSHLHGYVARRMWNSLWPARPEEDVPIGHVTNGVHALTIGFARRFATYKRADLILSDVERLARLVGDPNRPVHMVFAGKAHPRDDGGKALIRRIIELARVPRFADRIIFL